MRRTAPPLFLLLLAALPLRAQETSAGDQKGPTKVAAAVFQAEADVLRDAVASPAVDNYGARNKATKFFDGVPSRTPSFRPACVGRPGCVMDRESVDGHIGTIDGMLDEAQKRWDRYRFSLAGLVDPKLEAAIAYARDLRKQKRIDFDVKMPENQMGEFVYVKNHFDLGVIDLNTRLPLLASRIGEAFCYATLVHEAAHAKAHQENRLDSAHTIDDEVEAYRVEALWLKAIDPRAERMIVKISELKIHLKRHPTDQVSRLSVSYLEHLLLLLDTNGEDAKLRDLIRALGYKEDGVDPAATPIRA